MMNYKIHGLIEAQFILVWVQRKIISWVLIKKTLNNVANIILNNILKVIAVFNQTISYKLPQHWMKSTVPD